MKGVNFSFDDYDDVLKLLENVYMEDDTWDFEIVVTKEKEHYNVWIGDKEE